MGSSLKYRTLSSLFWAFVERAGNQFIALVVQIVMARLLSPGDFGALAVILVVINICNVLVASGLNTALVRDPEVQQNDYSTVFWMSFAMSVVLFVGIWILAPVVADIYDLPQIRAPLRAMGLLCIINSYNSIQMAIVRRRLELKKSFKATLASVVISGAIGVICALLGMGIWSLVVQQVSYQITMCMVLAVQVRWFPHMVFNTKRAQRLFSFGWKLLASGLLGEAYRGLTDLVVGKVFSSEILGFVSQGKKYPVALASILNGSIQPVMLSAASKMQTDAVALKSLARRALQTTSFFVIPAFLAFSLVSENLVNILLGEKWLPAVLFMQIYCFNCALDPIQTLNIQIINALGRSDVCLKLDIIKRSFGILLLIITAFVIRDVVAVVSASMLANVFAVVVNWWPSKKFIGYSGWQQIRDTLPIIGISLISVGAAYPITILHMDPALTIVCQILVIAIVYLLLAFACKIDVLNFFIATLRDFTNKSSNGYS